MAGTVLSAHIVVEFGDADASNFIVEVDDREGGYNNGKTSFFPGQAAHLLVFTPPGYVIDQALVTAGSLTLIKSNEVKAVQEYIEFPNVDDGSVNYPINNSFSYRWLSASNIGTLSVASPYKVTLPSRSVDASGNLVPKYRIGVAQVSYNSICAVYKVYGVPSNIEKVMAFFVARKV